MTKTELKKEVLKKVNKGLKALGRETLERLPKGRAYFNGNNPLALAFDSNNCSSHILTMSEEDAEALAEVWGDVPASTRTIGGLWDVGLPPLLEEFMHKFNAGEYLELVAK